MLLNNNDYLLVYHVNLLCLDRSPGVTSAELFTLTQSILRSDMSCNFFFESAPPGEIILWFTCPCKFQKKQKKTNLTLFLSICKKRYEKKKNNKYNQIQPKFAIFDKNAT